MNPQLQAWCERFAALQKRERALIAGATIMVIGMGGYSFGVEPASLKLTALQQQIAQQRGEIATAELQGTALRAQMQDPDAKNKASLAEIRQQLAAGEQELRKYDSMLVAPNRVPELLQALLGRHRGLTLLSLQSIPPVPLVAPPLPGDKDKAAPAAAPTTPPPLPGGNIFKHGIELKVAGSYADLLAYVAELEQAPQKLLWGKMNLAVTAYPRSELTLTVYTLSLDSRWLVL